MPKCTGILLILCLLLCLGAGQPQATEAETQLQLHPQADTIRVGLLLQAAAELLKQAPEKTQEYSTEALALSEKLNFEQGKLRAYLLKGSLALYEGAYEQSMALLQQAASPAVLLNDQGSLGKIYNNMAIIRRKQGDNTKALTLYLEALKAFEAQKDAFKAANVLTNIGNLYADFKRFPEAITHHKKALTRMLQLDKKSEAAAIYNNLGNTYYDMKEGEKALENYQKALELQTNLGDKRSMAITLHNLGNIYGDNKAYDQSIQHYAKALALAEEVADHYGISAYAASLGSAYTDTKAYNKAHQYLVVALEKAREIGAKPHELEIYEMMARLDSLEGDFKGAYLHQQAYMALKDTLFGLEKDKQIAQIQSRYKLADVEREYEALKRKLKQEESIIVVLAMLAGLALVLQRAYVRRRKKGQEQPAEEQEKLNLLETEKQRKEKELLQKNQELSTLHLQMMHQHQTLGAIKARILQNEKGVNVLQNPRPMQEIVREIDKVLTVEEHWEDFKIHFEGIHDGFFTRLQGRFPRLTCNDLKLCAYLRLSFTSKEIAQILNVSPAAIQKSRQRLRKKLELEAEDDLLAFLKGI